MIRATFAMFGAERMILISDSLRATGMPDGEYPFGGQMIEVHGTMQRFWAIRRRWQVL